VNCNLCFVARTARYAVFSEVKCLQAQFFILERCCIAAICKQKKLSLATTVKEKKVNLPSKVLSTKKSNKSVHFYHRGLA